MSRSIGGFEGCDCGKVALIILLYYISYARRNLNKKRGGTICTTPYARYRNHRWKAKSLLLEYRRHLPPHSINSVTKGRVVPLSLEEGLGWGGGLCLNNFIKTNIITGVSRGIGLATAKKFLAEGCRVIGTYNQNNIPINDSNLVAVQMEQSSAASVAGAVKEIKKVAPQIDALINNAGVTLDWVDPTINLVKIRQTFEVNVFGSVNFTEQLLALMSAQAHIVNIDSNYGSFSFPIERKRHYCFLD